MRVIGQRVDINVLRKLGWRLKPPSSIIERWYRGKRNVYVVKLRVIKGVVHSVDVYSDGRFLVSRMPSYLHRRFIADIQKAIVRR